MGSTFVQVKVGEKQIRKAQLLIVKKGVKPLIGFDWLAVVNYAVKHSKNKSKC